MSTWFISRFACIAALLHMSQAQAAESGVVTQRGTASFYADKLHGQRTASGEVLDQDAFTAASKTLPLGTYALVTNLETGKRVRVRINDRGPFTQGRIIDLSRRAATALEMDGRDGVARVVVEARAGDQPTAELQHRIAAAARRQ